jgi:type II secretory pathway pseudopilin PulG
VSPAGGAPERGESLVELLMSVALLGTAAVSILAAFGTLIKTSDAGRKTGSLAALLSATAEAVADNSRNAFQADCGPLGYDLTAVPPPPVGTPPVTIVGVKYWDGTAFGATCFDVTVPEYRLQLITLGGGARTTDGQPEQTIDVVKRG